MPDNMTNISNEQGRICAGAGGGYNYTNAEAGTIVASFPTAPNNAHKGYIDTLVGALYSALGITALNQAFDLLYVLAAQYADNAIKNWASPGTYDLTAHGSPTFTSNQGYAGDGSAAYFDTGWQPGTNAVKFTRNSGSVGGYNRTSRAAADKMLLGCGTAAATKSIKINPNFGSNYYFNVNASTNQDVSNTTSQGMFIGSRTASSTTVPYINGSAGSTDGTASVATAAVNLLLLAYNNNGTAQEFSSDQIAIAFAASGMTGTQAAAVSTAFNNYMTSLGTNVY